MQNIWSFGYRWPAVSQKQLLNSKLHYQLENSCYPNSSLSGTLYRSIISLHVHHAYLNTAQNIWVYSTLTHQVRGWVFLWFCASPLTPWLSWIVLILVDFTTNFLCISLCQHLRFFTCCIFLLHDLTFSLTFKCVQCQACKGIKRGIIQKKCVEYFIAI